MDNGWNYFRETGDIEAYLLYREWMRILDGEYSKEFMESKNEREDAGVDFEGSQHGGSRQDFDGADRE